MTIAPLFSVSSILSTTARSLIGLTLVALPAAAGGTAAGGPAAPFAGGAGAVAKGGDTRAGVVAAVQGAAPQPAAPWTQVASVRAGEGAVAPAGAFRAPLGGALVVLRRFEPPAQHWGPGHRGVDLAAVVGQDVLAPADGVVTFAARIVDRPVVVVSHGSLRSTLEPVAAVVPVGTTVTAGRAIGRLSSDPGHCVPVVCLHWGLLRGDTYLDPLALLAPRSVRLWPTR